jgi:CheY-like chemotaxis protein
MKQEPMPARALIVDDDAMSRELLCVLLEAEGYGVESADSGESALTLLNSSRNPPDVVLADVQMPGTTGAALADQLRRACKPSTFLLAMSGSRPPDSKISRFDGFLMKPFRMDELAAILSTGKPPAELETPSVAGAYSTPVLNESIYQQLSASMPAPQLLEMYTMCVNDARERIASMRRDVDAHDSPHFVREAHAIKGSAGMLGATQLHGLAAELENNGLESSGSYQQQDVNSLDELSAACDRLERMLGARV